MSNPFGSKYLRHGDSRTRFYKTWLDILARCNNPKRKDYKYYGGRGIKVEWKNYIEFKKDMYQSYQRHVRKYGEKETTLERKNYNNSYSKENCRWATWYEQFRNTRKNRFITFRGETKTLSDWSRSLNINIRTLHSRLKVKSPQLAFTLGRYETLITRYKDKLSEIKSINQ